MSTDFRPEIQPTQKQEQPPVASEQKDGVMYTESGLPRKVHQIDSDKTVRPLQTHGGIFDGLRDRIVQVLSALNHMAVSINRMFHNVVAHICVIAPKSSTVSFKDGLRGASEEKNYVDVLVQEIREFENKPAGELSSKHSEQFLKDITARETVRIKIGDVAFIHGDADTVGESLREIFNKVPSLLHPENKIELLRYQIEDYILSQTCWALDNPFMLRFMADYGHDGKVVAAETSRLVYTVSEKDGILKVTTSAKYQEVRDLNNPSKITGWDATRMVVTVDLHKINEKELLLSPGAVTVFTESHGFRKSRDKISF